MRILHLTSGPLSAGAARGALWLHEGLRECGVESILVTTSSGEVEDENIVGVERFSKTARKWICRIEKVPLLFYQHRNKRNQFSLGCIGLSVEPLVDRFQPDLVNLHWINGSFLNATTLSRVNVPVVWTLRDMWPITGGCHYSYGCDNYKSSCGSCAYLGSTSNRDLSRAMHALRKKNLPKKLYISSISEWLAKAARESTMLGGLSIKTLGNAVRESAFFPTSRKSAREAIGLTEDRSVVLLGAQDLDDDYKGGKVVVKALKHLDKKSFSLLLFGKVGEKFLAKLEGWTVINLGFISDESQLRTAYNASDVFVCPSLYEAFGKTIVEANMCGTPVVGFNRFGPAELIMHKRTGYLCEWNDADALAAGIKWSLAEDAGFLRKNCVEESSRHSRKTVARRYVDYYKEILTTESS